MAVWDREDAAGRAEMTRSFCPALRRAAVCMTGGCEHKRLLGRGRYLPYPGDVGELEEGEDAEEDFRGKEDEEHGSLCLLTLVRVLTSSPPPCTGGTSIRGPSTTRTWPTSTRRWPRCTSLSRISLARRRSFCLPISLVSPSRGPKTINFQNEQAQRCVLHLPAITRLIILLGSVQMSDPGTALPRL